ncbi:hypothetical protein CYMTET_25671 [Cymbomonas tetramitiformis]|uniref:Uncharacterized protein n=1 Tax=Cymbomonas tetramitiformis TaxID=36881 RepID=A0AAE0KYQ0_9CHLO|nr:hypothetical protein CYMTET_25671 [Cymbomonas tetramitiformis]
MQVKKLQAESTATQEQKQRLEETVGILEEERSQAAKDRVTAHAGTTAQQELYDRMKTALEAKQSEVQQLQSRILQLERQATALRADLAGKAAELRGKERSLQAYEDNIGLQLDGSLGAGPALGGGSQKDYSALDGGDKGPLAQLRTLMGEAYLLKMAINKQSAGDRKDPLSKEVSTALDAWIMASHTLKKACQNKGL